MQIALSKSYDINNYIIALNIKHIYPSIKFKSIEEKIKEFQKNFSIFEARKTSFGIDGWIDGQKDDQNGADVK